MDELEISGKRYISSRRAAKERGYHVDYIGQLIRSGKVLGSKVGRSWYVEAESLERYLSGEEAPATHIQPSAPIVEEKIVEVAKPVAAPVPASVETDEIREVPLTPIKESEESHSIVINKMPKMGLTYIADEAPLLPEIRPSVKQTYIPYEEEPAEKAIVEEKEQPRAIQSRRSFVPMVVLVGVGMLVLAGAAASSMFINSRIVLEQGKPATVEYSLHK